MESLDCLKDEHLYAALWKKMVHFIKPLSPALKKHAFIFFNSLLDYCVSIIIQMFRSNSHIVMHPIHLFWMCLVIMSIILPWHHHAAAAAHLWCESPIPSHEMMLMTADVRLTTVNLLSCCKKPVWDVFNFVAWGVILPTLLTQDRMVPCFHVETRQHLLQCLVTPCAFRDAPLHTLIVTNGC